MYETLCGQPAIEGDNALQMIYNHINEMPPSVIERAPGRNIPKALSDIISKSLAKETNQRYQSVQELENDLRQVITPTSLASSASLAVRKEKVLAKENWDKIFAALWILIVSGVFGWNVLNSNLEAQKLMAAYESPNNVRLNYHFGDTVGKPELQVIFAHQAANQARSMDNDYNHWGNISVKISKEHKDLVLALCGYAPIHWHVNVEDGAVIKEVILSGIYRQQVSGLAPGTKLVETSDYDLTKNDRKPKKFDAFNLVLIKGENPRANSNFVSMSDTLRKETGREITELHYTSIGHKFRI